MVDITSYFGAHFLQSNVGKWAGELQLPSGRQQRAFVDCQTHGKRFYVNEISEGGESVLFWLDKRPNEYNDFLVAQAAATDKEIVRFLVGSNSKTFDYGDYKVTAREGLRVRLTRCGDGECLSTHSRFKHSSEEQADTLLRSIFSDLTVLYEPLSLNAYSGSWNTPLQDWAGTYCVDFTIAWRGRHVGVEVKCSMDAWVSKRAENVRKLQLFERLMGPCYLLVTRPQPAFYTLDGERLVSFSMDEFAHSTRAFVRRVGA